MTILLRTPDNLNNAQTGKPNIGAMLPYNPGPSALNAEGNYFQAAFPLTFTPFGGPNSPTPNNIVTLAGQEVGVLAYGRTLYAIQVSGTFVATVTVEATLERDAQGVPNWAPLDTFTAAGLKQYSGAYYALRFRISAWTSGAPLVTLQMQR